MSSLIHSFQRKSSFKLWKQSVALKKQLRHNWNHHPAQKPAGNPPHDPRCHQSMIPVCVTKIITKVWVMRNTEHPSRFNIYRTLTWVKSHNAVKAIYVGGGGGGLPFSKYKTHFHTVNAIIHTSVLVEFCHLDITLIVSKATEQSFSSCILHENSWDRRERVNSEGEHLPSSSW